MKDNLESAAKKYADSFNITDFYMEGDITEALTEAFEAGAEWQKNAEARPSEVMGAVDTAGWLAYFRRGASSLPSRLPGTNR